MITKFETVLIIIGLIGGFLMSSIFNTIYYDNGTLHTLATKAIAECESTLPRNQHCTIVGVVKENK